MEVNLSRAIGRSSRRGDMRRGLTFFASNLRPPIRQQYHTVPHPISSHIAIMNDSDFQIIHAIFLLVVLWSCVRFYGPPTVADRLYRIVAIVSAVVGTGRILYWLRNRSEY
jgi:hypothetical protein